MSGDASRPITSTAGSSSRTFIFFEDPDGNSNFRHGGLFIYQLGPVWYVIQILPELFCSVVLSHSRKSNSASLNRRLPLSFAHTHTTIIAIVDQRNNYDKIGRICVSMTGLIISRVQVCDPGLRNTPVAPDISGGGVSNPVGAMLLNHDSS